jgi:tetratricopeptide (TPR) repeat protein
LGLIDQARAFSGDLERNYPDYLPGKLLQVQLAVTTGDSKSALRLATELLDRLGKTAPNQDNSPQLLAEITEKTYLARGSIRGQQGDATGARQDFEAARAASPNDPDVYNNLAALSLTEKKTDDAVAFYESGLKIDGTNFNALNGLLTVYVRNKEFDKAHARIDQVLGSFPNNASLHYLKAQVFAAGQNAQGTEAELRKTLELDPNYIAAYSGLAALFISAKQEDKAIEEYKKITQLRPDNSAAYTLIAMLEDSRKNYDAAVENYRKALDRDPNAVFAANNLAWLYAVSGKGNLDEAVKLAQGVVQKNPNIAGFADTLGWVYYKKGLFAAATEQLQRAVSLDEAHARNNKTTPNPTYHYHLGMALKGKGDREGFRRELAAALRLGETRTFAEDEEARKALAEQ